MINESGFYYEDMTDEQLAAQALEAAIEHAEITLQLAENCYRKFGKQLLTDSQKAYFQNIANGNLPTDEEQIEYYIEAVKQARELNKQKAAQLGEEYQPEMILEDKTEGFAAN